jgi:hypothetical protein
MSPFFASASNCARALLVHSTTSGLGFVRPALQSADPSRVGVLVNEPAALPGVHAEAPIATPRRTTTAATARIDANVSARSCFLNQGKP